MMNLRLAMAKHLPVCVLQSARQTLANQEVVPLSPGGSTVGFCAAAAVANAAGHILRNPECQQILTRAMKEGDKMLLADAFDAVGLPKRLALEMLHTNDVLDGSVRKAALVQLFDGAIECRAR
jgi:hypothetical protein